MKTQNLLIVFASLLALSAQGAEGVGSRGGGRALVCRDGGKVVSARMLDLLEGIEPKPVGYGLSITELNDANLPKDQKETMVTDHLGQYLKKLDGLTYAAKVSDSVSTLRAEKIEEPAETDLIPPEDLGKVHIKTKPHNCALEAVGVYFEDNKLHVNPDIYDAMDTVNQSAFFLHEGVYAFARTSSPVGYDEMIAEEARAGHHELPAIGGTSEFSRSIVGQLISKTERLDYGIWAFSDGRADQKGAQFIFQSRGKPFITLYEKEFMALTDSVDAYKGITKYWMESDIYGLIVLHRTVEVRSTVLCNRQTHECVNQNPSEPNSWFSKISWDPASGNPPVATGLNGETLEGRRRP